MAIVLDGPVSPDALTQFTREVPTPAEYTLNQLLPDRYLDRNEVGISELTRTNRTARFRAFDGRLHVSERDTAALRSVKLPPLSTSISTGELERLQLEFARVGGTNRGALVGAIYDDATNLTREVQARMEQARGDVLTDGKFTLNDENGLTLEADFGVPTENLVTAATAWTNIAAPALDDLIAWADAYTSMNGAPPSIAVTSLRVARLLQRNTQIIEAVSGGTSGRTRVTREDVNALLTSEGLPAIDASYDTRVDRDGVDVQVIPDDRLIFAAPGIGYTAWGITATALELVDAAAVDFSFEDARGIVGVVEKSGPPYREWVFVDAVGMPVIEQPKRLFVADVA